MTLKETNKLPRCGRYAAAATRKASRLLLAAAVMVFMGAATAWGHDGSHSRDSDARNSPSAEKSQGCGPRGKCGMSSDYGSASASHGPPALPTSADSEPPMAMGRLAPHGGQVTAASRHDFEVVYMPQEVRIYIYSPSREQLSAQGVRGEVVMQVNGYAQPFRYPVQTVTDSAGLSYLSVAVNVSRVRDGDMQVTFQLTGLPLPDEPRARFTQTFALTPPAAPVREVPRTAAEPQRFPGQLPPGQNRTH